MDIGRELAEIGAPSKPIGGKRRVTWRNCGKTRKYLAHEAGVSPRFELGIVQIQFRSLVA
jgi:hypothetical protein